MNAELRKQEEEHVVVYVRVARARSGDDIRAERQRGHCLALCGRLGYEPDEIDVYQDVNAAARSGRTLPGFDEPWRECSPREPPRSWRGTSTGSVEPLGRWRAWSLWRRHGLCVSRPLQAPGSNSARPRVGRRPGDWSRSHRPVPGR